MDDKKKIETALSWINLNVDVHTWKDHKIKELWKILTTDEDETKFPEIEEGVFSWVNEEKIEDWFQRCMADFPNGEQITHSPVQSLTFYKWFEKWFSQFKEE